MNKWRKCEFNKVKDKKIDFENLEFKILPVKNQPSNNFTPLVRKRTNEDFVQSKKLKTNTFENKKDKKIDLDISNISDSSIHLDQNENVGNKDKKNQ